MDDNLTDAIAAATPNRYDVAPWLFWRYATDEEKAAQLYWQAELTQRGGIELGDKVFVSPLAAVFPDRLTVGNSSYIAAHAYVMEDVRMGAYCTLNPYTAARGLIRMGDRVRTGAHTSLLGFNHGTAPDRPVHEQPTTSRGITIGDDVWIGSHVVVVDGVVIGDHAVIGAGSVVTKDVAAWSVVAGNPAAPVRDRRSPSDGSLRGMDGRLHEFADQARSEAKDLLSYYWGASTDGSSGGSFVDRLDADPTVRAWCDAVEIADLLLESAPPQTPAEYVIEHLRSLQEHETGLVPEYGRSGRPSLDDEAALYHVLCVGYALELLGSSFTGPVHAIVDLDTQQLVDRLGAHDWRARGWKAGAWIDAIGTGAYRNRADFGMSGPIEPLFGWLLTHADRSHGMWGLPHPRIGWLQVVNGFYRLTRGTFAQYGIPLPYPERAIDTVLAHSRDNEYFGPSRGNACNVLDVIHPLWLCGKQTAYRRSEGEVWARWQLDRALSGWRPKTGFAFALEPGPGPEHAPSLRGTEMWLAIVWLLADYVGHRDALPYRPRGIHRPEPAL